MKANFRNGGGPGHTRALFNLGVSYNRGRGVPQDNVAAYMWLSLAADPRMGEPAGAFRDAVIQALDTVSAMLTPYRRAEGQRLALEWDAAHPPD